MRKLKLGAAGLGRAFSLMAETFARDPRIELVAGADPREAARKQFERDFHGKGFSGVDDLCALKDLDVIYVATPHQFHVGNVETACSFKKHVLVEKPMALSLDECRQMISAAERAGVRLVVGHSHSFDLPILKTKQLVDSGTFGRVRMITAVNFTDFLYRPRRPEELDTTRGGGAVCSRNYGGNAYGGPSAAFPQHFGSLVVSCERAGLRPLPGGVMVYADAEKRLEPLPAPKLPRTEVIDELYGAVVDGRPPLHDGAWSMATLEVCLAILASARARKEVPLSLQSTARPT